MNKRYEKAKEMFRGREFVAQHPKTGLWHGIDPVLRTPSTKGFKSKEKAKAAWREVEATGLCCHTDATNSLLSDSLSPIDQLGKTVGDND